MRYYGNELRQRKWWNEVGPYGTVATFLHIMRFEASDKT